MHKWQLFPDPIAYMYIAAIIRPRPIMLKILPIMLLSSAQNNCQYYALESLAQKSF